VHKAHPIVKVCHPSRPHDDPQALQNRREPCGVQFGHHNSLRQGIEHSSVLSNKTWLGVVPCADVCESDPIQFPNTSATVPPLWSMSTAAPLLTRLIQSQTLHRSMRRTVRCVTFAKCAQSNLAARTCCWVKAACGSSPMMIHQPTWAALPSRANCEIFSQY